MSDEFLFFTSGVTCTMFVLLGSKISRRTTTLLWGASGLATFILSGIILYEPTAHFIGKLMEASR